MELRKSIALLSGRLRGVMDDLGAVYESLDTLHDEVIDYYKELLKKPSVSTTGGKDIVESPPTMIGKAKGVSHEDEASDDAETLALEEELKKILRDVFGDENVSIRVRRLK